MPAWFDAPDVKAEHFETGLRLTLWLPKALFTELQTRELDGHKPLHQYEQGPENILAIGAVLFIASALASLVLSMNTC
jgi:hypothetical protein